MKRVFVNGYGSIGRRIASFLLEDPEIDLVGIGKQTPDGMVGDARRRGLGVYVPADRLESFDGLGISGTIESALDSSDLVIDASPGGSGFENKKSLYEPASIKAIYQGGETVYGERAVSDILFNSRANYDAALGCDAAMQASCNVTGMGRILQPLREEYGAKILRFDLTLIRRWADIEQTAKKIPDTIEITQNPHHADDLKASMGKETPLYLRALKVPTRQMHLHVLDIRFADDAPDGQKILDVYAEEPGVAILWGARGTRDVREYADSMGFSFSDTNLVHIHAETAVRIRDTVQMMYSDDQTGIVIPENHMLLQAMLFERGYEDAYNHTMRLFHMDEKKQRLQAHFARP